MTTTTTTDWNTRWEFSREQAHKDHANSRQATIEAKRQAMRQSAAITPRIATTPEFSGYIVGLVDLLRSAS